MSIKAPNIFISWSGPRSKHVATALREWLPDILQTARPWMSESDIAKGSRGLEEIVKALETIEVGIICLTPENLTAPWLLFEAGALSKRIGEKSRLCTYLLGGLGHGDVPPPLGMFQHTRANKEETKRMIDSINRAINFDGPVSLDRLFERMWSDLDKEIKNLPAPEKNVPAKRPVEDMFAEILSILRSESKFKGQLDEIITALRSRTFVDPAFGGSIPINRLAQLRFFLEDSTPTNIKQLVPEEEWIRAHPRCPACGNASVAQDSTGTGKHCLSCGAATEDGVTDKEQP